MGDASNDDRWGQPNRLLGARRELRPNLNLCADRRPLSGVPPDSPATGCPRHRPGPSPSIARSSSEEPAHPRPILGAGRVGTARKVEFHMGPRRSGLAAVSRETQRGANEYRPHFAHALRHSHPNPGSPAVRSRGPACWEFDGHPGACFRSELPARTVSRRPIPTWPAEVSRETRQGNRVLIHGECSRGEQGHVPESNVHGIHRRSLKSCSSRPGGAPHARSLTDTCPGRSPTQRRRICTQPRDDSVSMGGADSQAHASTSCFTWNNSDGRSVHRSRQ